MKIDFSERFGFLVSDTGRLYGRVFDQQARQQIGLSLAQCRLLGVLASCQGEKPLSQAELAERLDLTPMGVATLCDRMAAAGWLCRMPCATDRRVNEIELLPPAFQALEAAIALGDALQVQAQAGLNEEESRQLRDLLRKVHVNLGKLCHR
jgi:DNA-binding MarR family transcriptional regulator